MNGNTVAKTGGGLAFATGLVIFFVHGLDYTDVEIVLMSTAGGVVVTYLVNLLEHLAFGKDMDFSDTSKQDPAPEPRTVNQVMADRL